ncbi:MAG: disulfide bond formation protein B [Betaproteobacteria bacterium]|nr:disulfide bond formation protein B [Betaproteobacteria bacterium]
MFPSPRHVFMAIFLACAGSLAFGLYLQEYRNLLACPMCVVQRIAYFGIGLTALAGAIHDPARIGRYVYSGLAGTFALTGLAVALRQVWLVYHPQLAECGISPEEAFLNALPLAKWWPAMFTANGDCARVTWSFLGLSIPELSAALFLGLLALAILAAFVSPKDKLAPVRG